MDSHQGEDVVGDPGVRRGDAATPSPDISLTDREVTEDPGTMSPGIASASSDRELTPAVDSTKLIEEKTVQTMAKTMVETMLMSRAGSPEDSNYLPENLAELFVKKEFVNPQVKALLYGLDSINCRELADELHDFARDIGVTETQNAPLVSGQGDTAGI